MRRGGFVSHMSLIFHIFKYAKRHISTLYLVFLISYFAFLISYLVFSQTRRQLIDAHSFDDFEGVRVGIDFFIENALVVDAVDAHAA